MAVDEAIKFIQNESCEFSIEILLWLMIHNNHRIIIRGNYVEKNVIRSLTFYYPSF